MRRTPRATLFVKHLLRLAPGFGLELSAETLDMLVVHYELLLRWNEKVNLTSVDQPGQAAQFHYLESLYGTKWLDTDCHHLVDIGSGAGFPGLVIAVSQPWLRVTLVERNRKRAAFLQEAIARLGLERVKVFSGPYQDYSEQDFDLLTCRGLDRLEQELPSLLGLSKHVRQVLLFCTTKAITWIEAAAASYWRLQLQRIPLSRQRVLAILHRRDITAS